MILTNSNRDGSCHGRTASSWSDPHQAPPQPYFMLQQVLMHIKYNHMQNYMRIKNRDYYEGKRDNFNRF